MAQVIKMPKMGNTVKSVILSKWHVKEGDLLDLDQKFYSYETDKTQVDELSKIKGVVLKILVKENDEIAVFSPIAIIGKKDDDIKDLLKSLDLKPQVNLTTKKEESQALTPAIEESKVPVQVESPNQISNLKSQAISPRALRTLRRSGINLENAHYQSGPNNRLKSNDVLKSMTVQNLSQTNTPSSKQDLVEVKLNDFSALAKTSQGDFNFEYSPMRKAIARAMLKSQQQSSFSTLSTTIDASKLVEARALIKKAIATGGPNISINDLIVFALSRVLPKHSKTINTHVGDQDGVGHKHVNIAIAVDTPHGLIVPVLSNANLKSLKTINQEAQAMIKLVRQGEYQKVDLKSGTFTISNVGAMGIEVFTPILNDGQGAILGVGALVVRPRRNPKSGLIEFYDGLVLSLTIDHRLVDGADGARFLNDLKIVLENIDKLMQGENDG